MDNQRLNDILTLILKDGLTTYKTIGSKATLPARVEASKRDKLHRKGAIFAVRSKEDFTEYGVNGYIVTSKETLVEDADNLTHFTPNVYRTFNYTNEKRSKIEGFEEQNLLQVNTFVVDIDTKAHDVQDIVIAAMDNSVGVPTLILESVRGYQVHFVLNTPIYISNARNYISLTVAKRVADNIKRSLQTVDADVFCNSFGFFRMPRTDNVVWYRPEATYAPKELIDWSMRQDDNVDRQLFVIPSKANGSGSNLSENEWFQELIAATDTQGKKGELGRNNLLFTLALTCLQDGRDEEQALNFIDEMNIRLRHPLKGNEIRAIVASAYSGRYHGPSKEYIEALLSLHGKRQVEVKLNTNGWYKHKKERADRVRSHLSEWEQDFKAYIEANGPFVQMTQAEMCEALNIPKSTLNKLVKESRIVMKKAIGKGRSAVTLWTTAAAFIKHAIETARTRQESFTEALRAIIQAAKLNEKYESHKQVLRYAYELTKAQSLNDENMLYTRDLFG